MDCVGFGRQFLLNFVFPNLRLAFRIAHCQFHISYFAFRGWGFHFLLLLLLFQLMSPVVDSKMGYFCLSLSSVFSPEIQAMITALSDTEGAPERDLSELPTKMLFHLKLREFACIAFRVQQEKTSWARSGHPYPLYKLSRIRFGNELRLGFHNMYKPTKIWPERGVSVWLLGRYWI